MAKRLIDWTLVGSVLAMGKYIDSDTPADELEKFDLTELFPEFKDLNEVQRFLVVYGIKQKLADCGSSVKVAEEKAKLAKAKFQDFVDGKLVGERANGTGAKENKRLVGSLKAVCQVVSLEGLNAKKCFFPDTFTKGDQKKLDEFNILAAEHLIKQRKMKK